MVIEIITTGSELLLGQILNTNANFLARKLNDIGYDVHFQTTVGDNRTRMAEVFTVALNRADIIITSGGLGPTRGDITKEVMAELLKIPLALDNTTLQRIKKNFAHREIAMSPAVAKQAMIPAGAITLPNERGTAPGIIIERENKTIVHLPGPPRELENMVLNSLIPYLKKRFSVQGRIISKVLRTVGIGESLVEDSIKDIILNQKNPTVALLARKDGVIIRLTAKAATEEKAWQLINPLRKEVISRLKNYIYGEDDTTMENVVGQLLTKYNLTVSVAESCTGGLITSRLTDIPGSSDYLIGSLVCYSNQVKINDLGVPEAIIHRQGAVSEETAGYMATGVCAKFGVDIGLAVTGIAGPAGGSPEKPVGLVYVAISGNGKIQCRKYKFAGERAHIKFLASQAALELLRQYLLRLSVGGA